MSSTMELDQFPNPKEKSYYGCTRRSRLFYCTTRIVHLIETAEKEVQDNSCRESGGAPQLEKSPTIGG